MQVINLWEILRKMQKGLSISAQIVVLWEVTVKTKTACESTIKFKRTFGGKILNNDFEELFKT